MYKLSALVILFLFCLSPSCQSQNQIKKKWNGKKFAVSLSYDDALNVHIDKAIPVLDSLGIKATFYVPAHSGCLMSRKEEWIKIAENGHELGNHTLFHPCSGAGDARSWVSPEYDLDTYSLSRITDEIHLANDILHAMDGKTDRSFAYTCGDTKAGNTSFVNEIKDDFVAARGVERSNNKLYQTDLFSLTTFSVNNHSMAQLIGAVEKARSENAYLVFLFHGVGGEHDLDCDERNHLMLLEYLKRIEEDVWIAPVVEISTYIKKHQNQ